MPSMSDKLTHELKKLAESQKLNENELASCIKQVKQLAPDQQKQFSNVLDNIKAQLKPISVTQLDKVKSVLGIQKHSGPALLSHVELCLGQNQLIAKSINTTKSLIEQAFNRSLNDPGQRSRVMQKNLAQEEAEEMQQNNMSSPQMNTPRPGGTNNQGTARSTAGTVAIQNSLRNPRQPAAVPLNTPLMNSYAILRPEMRLLAKMLLIKKEGKVQQNIKQGLREDAYVDEQILNLDKEVDTEIFTKSRESNKELQKELKETTSMELEEDYFLRDKILDRSKDLESNFKQQQRYIKQELNALLQQQNVPSETPTFNNKGPQFSG